MPLYHVESYLAEALDSVVAQTIGFSDNIQLVLVNDGSTDGTESICLEYRDAYPDNVTYIRQENAGVSAARNAGLRHARGEYVNFFDGDDRWEPDAFASALACFDHNPGIDVVAARIAFFGARTDYHPIDYKFGTDDEVVDIHSEPSRIHMHVGSALIRRSAIGDRVFDVRLKYAEDLAFIAPIIMAKGCYAAASSAIYGYRRRASGDSAINVSMRSRSWYFDTLELCHRMLFELSRAEHGCVIPYLQHCIMYDLQVRLRTRVSYELSTEEVARYKALITGLLAEIDDEVILAQRNIYTENKLYALALKGGVSITDLRRNLRIEPDGVYHNDLVVRSLPRGQKLVIEFLELEGDSLRIEGHVTSVIENSSVSLAFDVDGELIEASLVERPERRRFSLDERIHDAVGFVAVIPLRESQDVTPVLRLRDVEIEPVLVYGVHAGLTEAMKTSYFSAGRWFVNRRGKSSFHVCRDTRPLPLLRRERRYLKELVEQKDRRDLAWYRVFYRLLKPLLLGRKVWIVSDRIMMARDNGEAFFRFLQKHPSWSVRPYFALSPASVDYPKLKRVGRVVEYDSVKYRLLALLSDAIISSAADDHVTSVFDEDDIYMKNLFAFKFVFLQHGVTQSDLSMWLNRYRKNIRILVTSAVPEYDSIVDGNYYYSSREVKLTGLPRHERLLTSGTVVEKKILIMPTWRKRLAGALDRATGLRSRHPGFTESEYFRFYNSLISDPVLLEALRARGYTLKFIMHPMLIQEAEEFTASDIVSIETNCDYAHEFVSACLMVTDYSSVAFDFALLGKPVIYAQYDRAGLIANHIMAEGYFSYQDHGFGPVCTGYEQTIAAILAALDADCAMQEPYRSRVSAFFPERELNSCESIQRAILEA